METKEGDKCDMCDGILVIKLTPDSIHYGKLVCNKCGKYFKHIPAPNPEGIRKKVSRYGLEQVMKFYGIKEPFCFFCNRTKEELGFNEALTRDHILELNAGGKDELQNIQIMCSACQKLKLWYITYIKNHLASRIKDD